MLSGSNKSKKDKKGKNLSFFASLALFAFIASYSPFNKTTNLPRPALGKTQQKQDRSAVVRLGERLFNDDRFSTPNGDLPASCSNCHLFDQDPQGMRAYADFLNRSWVSSRAQD